MSRRARRLVVVCAAVVAVLGVAVPAIVAVIGRTSSASFADQEVLEANRLGAAVVDVEVATGVGAGSGTDDGGSTEAGEPASAVFSATNLAPGDSVSGQLELVNVGDLPVRFGLSALTDGGPLATWLHFEVWAGRERCQPGQAGPRLVEDVALSPTSTVLVEMASTAAATLEPGRSTILCLGAHLPLETPNQAQGQAVDVTLVVHAEQVVGEDGS